MEVFDRFNVWDRDEKNVKKQEKEKCSGRVFEVDEGGIKILNEADGTEIMSITNRDGKPTKMVYQGPFMNIEAGDASRIKETVAELQKYLEENGISADIKDCIDRTKKLRNDVDQMENNAAIINSIRSDLYKLESQVFAFESRVNRLENTMRNMVSYFRSMPF